MLHKSVLHEVNVWKNTKQNFPVACNETKM